MPSIECKECKGYGYIKSKECPKCHGVGKTWRKPTDKELDNIIKMIREG